MKKLVIFAILALTLFYGVEARAIIFGVRLSNTLGQPLPPSFGDGASRGRFGIYLGTKEGPSTFLFGADYDRHKTLRGDTLLYARRLTVNFGYRYMLLPADKSTAMNFMPFISAHVFKSYSKINADSNIVSTADADYYEDISNDSGAWLALGAEYFFAPVFSLGAEGGVRYSRANSKAYGYDIKIRDYTTFAALLLTYYW